MSDNDSKLIAWIAENVMGLTPGEPPLSVGEFLMSSTGKFTLNKKDVPYALIREVEDFRQFNPLVKLDDAFQVIEQMTKKGEYSFHLIRWPNGEEWQAAFSNSIWADSPGKAICLAAKATLEGREK